jgi:hypothetical protein
VLPEESGGLPPNVPPARPLQLPPLRPPDTWPVTAALLICLGVVARLLAGGAAAHIRRHGRRRDWQPAPTGIWQKPAAGPASPMQASQ